MAVSELKEGAIIEGPKWPDPVEIKKIESFGDDVKIIGSRMPSGIHVDVILSKDELSHISLKKIDCDFSSESWKVFLALETIRYRFASRYDPLLAMNTSKIDPLPHQIEAVYGHVLRMPRIRFLLAHDPGAGKTIMAGLIINLRKKKLFRAILIARDAIIARVHGPAGCRIWPDPCLEPESRVRCRGGWTKHGRPVSVMLP